MVLVPPSLYLCQMKVKRPVSVNMRLKLFYELYALTEQTKVTLSRVEFSHFGVGEDVIKIGK